MKVGDYVLKSKGHHAGKSGIILKVHTNSLGNTILLVYSGGLRRKWYSDFVEVIIESR